MRYLISALLICIWALSARAAGPSSTKPDEVAAALKAGEGVALIEVTAVKERDDRPSDGNLVDIVSFKTVKSKGTIPSDIRITKAFGGRRVGAAPVPAGPLFPNPLVAGQRYWVIFNESDFQKYQQGVVAWWTEKDAPAALETAVGGKADKVDVTAALNSGKALALIEVTAIKEQDQRPADGDCFDLVTYKVVKSTGKVPTDIRIIKAYAYPQIAGMPARGPVPTGILFPNPLVAGQRYWVIFSRGDSQKYQDGVVAWWPEKDAPAALDEAVTAKKYDKQPQGSPQRHIMGGFIYAYSTCEFPERSRQILTGILTLRHQENRQHIGPQNMTKRPLKDRKRKRENLIFADERAMIRGEGFSNLPASRATARCGEKLVSNRCFMNRYSGIASAVGLVALIAAFAPGQTTQTPAAERKPIVAGEQAPRADPGQRNFGGSMPAVGAGARRGGIARSGPAAAAQTVSLDDMSMSDPYIYADAKSQTYYLTGTGGRLYKSKDLKTWTSLPGPIIDLTGTWMNGLFVAAAEIHHIGDKYYYAGTWSDHSTLIQAVPRRYNVPRNQTQLLVADTPEGPYKPLVAERNFCLGPEDWDIIDGTLYQENDVTYMVFVHEWTQLIDGTMDYMPLSKDLTHRTAEPTTIFRASEAAWSKEMNSIGEATFGLKMPGWVTDGPQMFRTKTGKLGMLWSSWGVNRYAQGIAYSTSGSIKGPWVQEKEAFKGDNSGHGMLFTTFEGKRLFLLHHAEENGARKPQLYEVDDSGDKLVLGKKYNP